MAEPLRIAYVSADPGIPADGVKGASVHFRELGEALVREGLDLDAYVAREGTGQDRALPAKVIPAGRLGTGVEREVRQISGQRRLLDALSEGGSHDAVYERHSLFGFAGMAHARARGIPHILEVNAPLWNEAERYRELHLREGARGLCRDVLSGADRVLVVSRSLRDIVVGEGVPPGRVIVAPNGVNLPLFLRARPAPRPPALEGRPTMIFVGSLKPWHGVPFLLRAFRTLAERRDVGLWVVGDGPLREQAEEAARRLPGRIVVQGGVPHHEIPSLLRAADISVAPYPADAPDYFSPLKVVEALAAGCPLLASDTPCVREALGPVAPGALFEPDDVGSFVRVAERLLDDPGRRSDLSHAGREQILGMDTWARRASQIRELIRICSDERRASSRPASSTAAGSALAGEGAR